MKQLDYTVYPSTKQTIVVEADKDYGGAHKYTITNSTGFSNREAQYVDSTQTIQFVQKNLDGSMTPGLQSEQIAYVLLDRCIKLNNRFPSEQNEQMISGLRLFLAACHDRVEERINRGVMGNLVK